MTDQLATRPAAQLAPRDEWTQQKIDVLRQLIGRDCTDAHLAAAIEFGRATDLNPITKQYAAVVRAGVLSLQFMIDGLRAIMLRTGEYDGEEGPLYASQEDAKNGVWRDVWPDPTKPPYAAKFTVWRKGAARGTPRVVHYHEFAKLGSNNQLWQKIPIHMLGIRAQTHALRSAFQAEISRAEEAGVRALEYAAGAKVTFAAEVTTPEILEAERTAPALVDAVPPQPVMWTESETRAIMSEPPPDDAPPPAAEWPEPTPICRETRAPEPAAGDNAATPKQLNFIRKMLREAGRDVDEAALAAFTKLDASRYIEELRGGE